MTSLEGHSLGRYTIFQKLADGGMASVYIASDIHLDRTVAVKIIRKDHFSPIALTRVLKRFEREAKSLAQLSHPNIAKILDYGEYQDSPFLVLEYYSRGTLKQRINRKVTYQEAIRWLLPISRALAYAHQRGIIHRDIKPSNILIADSDEPVLADFGIAKILEARDGETLTSSGVGIGTPEYMAPEQGMGQAIDARTDIYSLGVVFYELITGRKPFSADTPMAIVLKHVSEPVPSPRQFAPSLPEAVEQTILKVMAKSPDERYQSMNAFHNQLSLLSSGEKVKITSEAEETRQSTTRSLSTTHKSRKATRVTDKIAQLEEEIKEALDREDFLLTAQLLSSMDELDKNGQEAALRLRPEFERVRNQVRQREEEISQLTSDVEKSIVDEDFTQAEMLLQALQALGPRGQAQAVIFKETLDKARKQALQRKAYIYSLVRQTERQITDKAWASVQISLNQLRELGFEGDEAAKRLEARVRDLHDSHPGLIEEEKAPSISVWERIFQRLSFHKNYRRIRVVLVLTCLGILLLVAGIYFWPSITQAAISGTQTVMAAQLQSGLLSAEMATNTPTVKIISTSQPISTAAITVTSSATLSPASTSTNSLKPSPSVTPTTIPMLRVKVDSARYRAGPGTIYPILGFLSQGTQLETVGCNGNQDWFLVQLENGDRVWIAVSVVEHSIEMALLPVVLAPPTPQPRLPTLTSESEDSGPVTVIDKTETPTPPPP